MGRREVMDVRLWTCVKWYGRWFMTQKTKSAGSRSLCQFQYGSCDGEAIVESEGKKAGGMSRGTKILSRFCTP